MCNLHPIAPRDHVAHHFRAMVPTSGAVPVGSFCTELLLRPTDSRRQGVIGQWGMTQPKASARRPESRAILTNNACRETVASRPSCRTAGAVGQSCLIPAAWYQEPNRETGRYGWWRMARAAGEPSAIARLWSEWTDPATDEIVPNFTMLTVNCVGQPLLGRLHKPNPELPADAQDKRSIVPQESGQRTAWFEATPDDAMDCMLAAPPTERFDLSDAQRTEQLLGRQSGR